MDQLKAKDIANYYAEYESLKWVSELPESSTHFEPKFNDMAGFSGVRSVMKHGILKASERAVRDKTKARMEEIEFLFKVAGIEL